MSHIIYSSAAALFTAVAVSCTGIAVDIPSEGAGEGLYVSLSTKGNSNDDGTRESIVDHIDIFIFDGQTGNIAYAGGVPCYYHIGLADCKLAVDVRLGDPAVHAGGCIDYSTARSRSCLAVFRFQQLQAVNESRTIDNIPH